MMLITSSTPRITYRMGMRAGLDSLDDKVLPSLVADAVDEVAAFTGTSQSLIGKGKQAVDKAQLRALRKYSHAHDRRMPVDSRSEPHCVSAFADALYFNSFLISLQCMRMTWLSSIAFLNSGLVTTS